MARSIVATSPPSRRSIDRSVRPVRPASTSERMRRRSTTAPTTSTANGEPQRGQDPVPSPPPGARTRRSSEPRGPELPTSSQPGGLGLRGEEAATDEHDAHGGATQDQRQVALPPVAARPPPVVEARVVGATTSDESVVLSVVLSVALSVAPSLAPSDAPSEAPSRWCRRMVPSLPPPARAGGGGEHHAADAQQPAEQGGPHEPAQLVLATFPQLGSPLVPHVPGVW